MTNQLNPTVYSLTADVPTGMTITEDSRFKSVALLNAGQSTLGQLTATSQSFSVWLKRQSVTADITFAITHGWAIKDDGVVWLDGVETDTVIPAEQWFHLTLVCTEKRLTLYVNGDYASHKDGTFAAASGDLAFSSVSGGVCLYQQIVFDYVLEDTAVQSNFFGSQPTVKQSFTHVQPIDVKIENSTTSKFSSYPDNKIFIVKVEDASADSGDEASNEKKAEIEQNLHIKNIGQEALEFLVLADSDLNLSPSIDHYHFEFRFRNGVFTGIKDYLSISSEEGWEFSEPTQNTDDNSWSIYGLAKSKKTLEKGGSFNFAFMYRTADAGRGERGTLLNVNYQNITSSSGNNVQGDKNIQIDVLNLAGINLTTPFTPEVYAASDIQFEDEETSGQETPRKVKGIFGLSSQVAVNSTTNVILELKNQSKKNIQFDTSRDNHGIEIHIPVGDLSSDLVESVDKLTTPIAPYVGEKIVGAFGKLSNSDDPAIFRWQPSKPSQNDDVYSAPIEPNDILRLGISEVITSSKQGLVNIKIVLRGVRDLATLAYSVNLMKVTRDIAEFVGAEHVGVGTGASNPYQKLDVRGNSYISGNVGIGKTSPTEKLDVNGAARAHVFKGHGIVPIGTVIDWYRASTSVPIPSGWRVADGAQLPFNTSVAPELRGKKMPDLRGRFVRGATTSNSSGYTSGGSDSHLHSININTGSAGSHNHQWLDYYIKGTYTFGSSGKPFFVSNSKRGYGLGGSGLYSYSWERFHRGHTSKQNDHYHSVSGDVEYGSTLPRYVGLLKLMRVL